MFFNRNTLSKVNLNPCRETSPSSLYNVMVQCMTRFNHAYASEMSED